MISRKLISNCSLWKLHLKPLFRFSTAADAAAAPPTLMTKFLINSLGFSKEEALAAAKKVHPSKSFRNDPNSVIGYFETLGFNKPQIKRIVTAYPRVLLPDPNKTFQPKINALQDLGLSGSDLITVLTKYGSLLCRPLKTDILAPIVYLTSVLGSKELLCKVLLKQPSFLHVYTLKKLAPNITYLQNLGFSQTKLSLMLMRCARNMLREPPFLEEVVQKVENTYMISRNSKMFFYLLLVFCSNSATTIEKKLDVFRSFGWSEENIHVMVRNSPYIVGSSEDKLKKVLDFYMNQVGYKPDFLASRPVLLNYSLEKRMKPRVKIMKTLIEKKLVDEKSGSYTYLTLKDLDFIQRFVLPCLDDVNLSVTDLEYLKKYILPFKDEMPDLCASNLNLHGRSKKTVGKYLDKQN